jgi:hypothetical protein
MVFDVYWTPLDYDDDHIQQVSNVFVVKINVVTLLKANVLQIDEFTVHVQLLVANYDAL